MAVGRSSIAPGSSGRPSRSSANRGLLRLDRRGHQVHRSKRQRPGKTQPPPAEDVPSCLPPHGSHLASQHGDAMDGLLGRAAGKTLPERKGSPADIHRGAGAHHRPRRRPVIAVFALAIALSGSSKVSEDTPRRESSRRTRAGWSCPCQSPASDRRTGSDRIRRSSRCRRPTSQVVGRSRREMGGQASNSFPTGTYTGALRRSWPFAVIGLVLGRGRCLGHASTVGAPGSGCHRRGRDPDRDPGSAGHRADHFDCGASRADMVAPALAADPRAGIVAVASSVLALLAAWTWAMVMNHEVYEPWIRFDESASTALAARDGLSRHLVWARDPA